MHASLEIWAICIALAPVSVICFGDPLLPPSPDTLCRGAMLEAGKQQMHFSMFGPIAVNETTEDFRAEDDDEEVEEEAKEDEEFLTPFDEFRDADIDNAIIRAAFAHTQTACGYGGFPNLQPDWDKPACFCDHACWHYGDCCPDKRLFDPEKEHPSHRNLGCTDIALKSGSLLVGVNLPTIGILAVSKCSSETEDEVLVEYCQDTTLFGLDHRTPVYDQSTGLHYRNHYCAECNGVHNYTVYRTGAICDPVIALSQANVPPQERYEEVMDEPLCDVVFIPPTSEVRECILGSPMINECNVTGLWSFNNGLVEHACRHVSLGTPFQYRHHPQIYRNMFCALCNEGVSWSCLQSLKSTLGSSELAKLQSSPWLQFLDLEESETSATSTPTSAAPRNMNAYRETLLEMGLTPVCPDGMKLQDSKCVTNDAHTDIMYIFCTRALVQYSDLVFFKWEFSVSSEMMRNRGGASFAGNHFLLSNVRCDLDIEEDETVEVFASARIIGQHSAFVRRRLLEYAGDFVEALKSTSGTRSVQLSGHDKCLQNEGAGSQELTEIETPNADGVCSFLDSRKPTDETFANDTVFSSLEHVIVSPLLTCMQVELSSSAFDILTPDVDPQLKVKATGLLLDESRFRFVDSRKESARVCLDDYLDALTSNPETSHPVTSDTVTFVSARPAWREALDMTSLVLSSVSLGGLGLVVASHALLSPLRTAPGLDTALLAALLLAATAHTSFTGLPPSSWACQVSGMAAHFLWMASFSMCSLCTWRVSMALVFPLPARAQSMSRWRSVLTSLAVSMGTAAGVVGLTILVHSVAWSSSGYGPVASSCFLLQPRSRILAFGVPIGLMVALNLVLLTLTFIRRKRHLPEEIFGFSRMGLSVYVVVSVLQGGSWLLGFLYEMSEQPVLAFLFVVLGSLHGLLLFLAFVTNKRVLRLLRLRLTSQTAPPVASDPSQVNEPPSPQA